MDAHVFRMASCFATGPEILLWWVGNLTPTLTTRPVLLVGALTVRLRWTPLMRFEALLGLFRISRSYRPALFVGTTSTLYSDSVYLWVVVAVFWEPRFVSFWIYFYPITLFCGLYPCL